MDCRGADAAKFMPLLDAVLNVTAWFGGLKVRPVLFGVTT